MVLPRLIRGCDAACKGMQPERGLKHYMKHYMKHCDQASSDAARLEPTSLMGNL